MSPELSVRAALVIGLPEYAHPVDVAFGKVLAMPLGAPCALTEPS